MCQAAKRLASNLENYFPVAYVGGLKKKTFPITKLKWLFYRKVVGKDYYRWSEPTVAKDYTFQVEKKLNRISHDVVFCAENALIAPYLKTSKPIVMWTDAPLASLIDFYPYMSNLCKETKNNILKLEKQAFLGSHKILFASEWAAEFALRTYGLNPDKVKVVPWGANLGPMPCKESICQKVLTRPIRPLKLLFIGKEWNRKGGNQILEIAKLLNLKGIETELIVIGCQPQIKGSLPTFVKVLGYLDKSTTEGWNQIVKVMESTHFLLLLSQSEGHFE